MFMDVQRKQFDFEEIKDNWVEDNYLAIFVAKHDGKVINTI